MPVSVPIAVFRMIEDGVGSNGSTALVQAALQFLAAGWRCAHRPPRAGHGRVAAPACRPHDSSPVASGLAPEPTLHEPSGNLVTLRKSHRLLQPALQVVLGRTAALYNRASSLHHIH